MLRYDDSSREQQQHQSMKQLATSNRPQSLLQHHHTHTHDTTPTSAIPDCNTCYTSVLDPPRSWRANEKQHALLLPPPANPACARPPRLRPRPAPSVDTIDPLPVEIQGPAARSSEHCCTRRHPRNPPRPWLSRPLRVAASRSMPVSPDTHHIILILYCRRHTLRSTLSTDTCYHQTSMPTQILPCLLADPPTTTPLLEHRHPAHPYLL